MGMMMRRDRGFFPEIFDMLESPLLSLRPMGQSLRFEDFVRDGQYVLRCELPGVDPAKDVEVTVAGGMLTIHAERHQEEKEGGRSEFRYGSMTRSVTLPTGAKEDEVTATYDKGILEICVNMAEAKQAGTRVPIAMPEKER
ncbi:Hsp20/alpha crystallin family protein [Acrocarpospora sp. B8E8]|uniref:Hsp20/alpha crystallin family protein n=1 Tax=Acrocarpospora sp. B8E8 TaxID=3153572 RepID=UPI00325D4FAB